MDTSKSLDELKRELVKLKAIHEQEKGKLEREKRELCEAQNRLAMHRDEKRQADGQLIELLTHLMIHSELGLAEFVLKGIAKIDGELKKPDPVTAEKCKEIAKIDDEFKKELGKLSGVEIDQALQRAQSEDEQLTQMAREREAELQRLKDTKEENRKKTSLRKKQHRQKVAQLTSQYTELHANAMKKKYGVGKSPESQAYDDDSDE